LRPTILVAAVALSGALGFAATAFAADDAPPPKTSAAGPHADDGRKKDDPDRIICKSPDVTGSRLPGKKICHTKREWDDISEEARKLMDLNRQTNPDKG
jgi:hypothetical protein